MTDFENKEALELSLDELAAIGGGYKKPAAKAGLTIYQIQKGDNLTRIAKKFGDTVAELLKLNPKITNKNVIYAGDYLYVVDRR